MYLKLGLLSSLIRSSEVGCMASNQWSLPPLTSRCLWIHGRYCLPSCIYNILRTSLPSDASLAGRYFGKKGQVLDKYGAHLAAAALPSHGYSVLHNKFQSILQEMMKLGSISSEMRLSTSSSTRLETPISLPMSPMYHPTCQQGGRHTSFAGRHRSLT